MTGHAWICLACGVLAGTTAGVLWLWLTGPRAVDPDDDDDLDGGAHG